ncbi:HNH endonuclease [Amycolatopsis arida]|uniref:HNH endonuclease n=2 Tax=Amycolatopsis arida TaxID=587909 RepID=A0A1I6B2Q0_9PSEU|nr:HNH endonuclease [Amycolatopsis arida]SFQ75067.1 HNH endonuclease [Amycolatopsis arida]
MRDAWERVGQSWVAVHDDLQLALFMRIGGNVLVEKEFADRRLADKVGPKECAPDGTILHGGGGFLVTEGLDDDAAERRAPSRKLRGQVLKRDDYRCVICGRRPRDHVDLELHVHHVIPWRMGGPTTEANLVTLCGACHKGLNPDYQPRVRELANLPGRAAPLDGTEHRADVQRYRELAERFFSCDDTPPTPQRHE